MTYEELKEHLEKNGPTFIKLKQVEPCMDAKMYTTLYLLVSKVAPAEMFDGMGYMTIPNGYTLDCIIRIDDSEYWEDYRDKPKERKQSVEFNRPVYVYGKQLETCTICKPPKDVCDMLTATLEEEKRRATETLNEWNAKRFGWIEESHG